MNAFQIMAASLSPSCPDYPDMPDDIADGICCMTGEHGPTTARKNCVKPSFTRLDVLASPDSDRVSVDAYLAMSYKWERMSSWLCDGTEFKRLDRIGVRNAVFADPPPSPWIGYATTSYKKHGILLTPVNSGERKSWAFENEVVHLTGDWLSWWKTLNHALRAGIGRTVIESLDCPGYLIHKIGLSNWLEFETWAKPKYKTALYRFLCYLLPSQEELKSEG